ncbi:hypothetical protein EXN32_25605, partial [Agrobacterium tumefaciens]
CASENCDAFIVFRSFPSQENAPENSNQKRSSLKGSDQARLGLSSLLAGLENSHLWLISAQRAPAASGLGCNPSYLQNRRSSDP